MKLMDRIQLLREALITAAVNWGMHRTIPEDEVIELLIDIRRLCRVSRLDYARCHFLARRHYELEMGLCRDGE